MTNIKIVRISTGEELIADVKEADGKIVLTDVAILIPTQQNQLGLAPFMAYSDASKGFDINTSMVMFMVDPVQDLQNQYQQMFSKIVTPSNEKKIIM